MKRYLVIYERAADGGWGAYVPDLPGCFTLGDTQAEAERHIREAVSAHLELLRARGDPIPEPSTVAADIIEVAP
ncbi:MAG: type II toxin-antitoxin system HicB family antitoxin [Candidatus Binataceae bacterium]